MDPIETDVAEYGLKHSTLPQIGAAMPMVPVASTYIGDSTGQFTRHGVNKFVNLVGDHAVVMGQTHVNAARVEQIRKSPSMGQDPRFPANHTRNIPNVLEVAASPKNRGATAQVVMQGTHRTAAAIANGQMFTEARVIPRERAVDARNDRSARNADPMWRIRAEFKQDTADDRYRYRQPLLRGPIDA